jgi:hypothetical protein
MVPKKNVVFFQLSELGSDLAYSFCAAAKPVLNVCGIQLETLLELMLCRHRSDGRQIIKGIEFCAMQVAMRLIINAPTLPPF